MNELCSFLHIPFQEAVLRPYDGQHARMITGNGDPNIMEHAGIDPRLGEIWKHIQLTRQLGAAAQSLARNYGYQLRS